MKSSPRLIVPVLALVAAALSAQAPDARADAPDKRTITLAATGTVKATPDEVDITTGVTSEGQTAREALDRNTDAMTKVVDGLKEAGIAPKDIQTTNFAVSPAYEQTKEGQSPFITGYRVTNSVYITVHNIAKLGDILDQAVSLGANQFGSIQFGLSKTEALKDEARKEAMANAIANAKLYADAAGVELGPVLTISEEPGPLQPRYGSRVGVALEKAVPIEAGTATVEVRLRVTWELR
jgi:uncharacterized protein YggE